MINASKTRDDAKISDIETESPSNILCYTSYQLYTRRVYKLIMLLPHFKVRHI